MPLKKKKKKSPPPFKAIFIQGWGTYNNETLVVVGMSVKEFMGRINVGKTGLGVNQKFYDWLVSRKENFTRSIALDNLGFFKDSPEGGSMLWLKEWDNSWDTGYTLMHELHHAVHFILGYNKGMQEECEALAYQQEWLFKAIQKRLTSRLKNPKWAKRK